MKKAEPEMRAEYKRANFGKLERGKFFKEVAKGRVLLDARFMHCDKDRHDRFDFAGT